MQAARDLAHFLGAVVTGRAHQLDVVDHDDLVLVSHGDGLNVRHGHAGRANDLQGIGSSRHNSLDDMLPAVILDLLVLDLGQSDAALLCYDAIHELLVLCLKREKADPVAL